MTRRVVVTGLGVVSPIGDGRDEFYEGLRQARSGIGPITSFDANGFAARIAGEVRKTVELPHWIPARDRSAIARDPKSRFAVAAAQQALEDAFKDREPSAVYDPRRISAYIASGLEIFHLQDLARHFHDGRVGAQSLLTAVRQSPAGAYGQIPSHLAARAIARHAGVKGRLAVNVSACAAGTQAIGEAFGAVRYGMADMAVAGGYDSMVNPLGIGGFCMLGALSCANHLGGAASRPFDAQRDGFVLGEGSAMLVLEPLDAARRRGAAVYAEILGYGSSLDAHAVADPAPDGSGARRAMQAALHQACLSPDRIGYINAHGTGTRKNDPMETGAIRRLFGAAADKIPVSSLKSQIGHLIGAAGAVEFIAGVFALTQSVLPATINLDRPDPACDLDYVPNRPRPAAIDTFLSNSFGFGGQNAVIVAGAVRPEGGR
jgi:3-oxoacyl-[acyl-carrier-protein] synthase II